MARLGIDIHKGGGWRAFRFPDKTCPTDVTPNETAGPKVVYALERVWVFWVENIALNPRVLYLTIDIDETVSAPRPVYIDGVGFLTLTYTPGVLGQTDGVSLLYYNESTKKFQLTTCTSTLPDAKFTAPIVFGDYDYGKPLATPTLASLHGEYRVGFVKQDGDIRIVKPAGDTDTPIVADRTGRTVAADSYQGHLYVAYTRRPDNVVWLTRVGDANSSSTPIMVPEPSANRVTSGVSSAVFRGILHFCHLTSDDDNGRCFRFDGVAFGPTAPMSTETTKKTLPSLAAASAWDELFSAYACGP